MLRLGCSLGNLAAKFKIEHLGREDCLAAKSPNNRMIKFICLDIAHSCSRQVRTWTTWILIVPSKGGRDPI